MDESRAQQDYEETMNIAQDRNVGFTTPSWKSSWFPKALVEEYLVSRHPRGILVGFQNTLVEV